MAKPQGNKSALPPKPGGNRLLTGLLVGMVVGVGLAAVLAWYVMKSPSPFAQKNTAENKPPVAVDRLATAEKVAPKPKTPTTDPATANSKPRFEFYNVLTNKQDVAATAPAKPVEDGKAAGEVARILQAGSFSNVDDAEKLKAKLAMLGAEANVQTAAIPDKGVWYRVRLGPYKNADELNKAKAFLKQNGVDSTPMRAQ
jgi:cell division protein FtsN